MGTWGSLSLGLFCPFFHRVATKCVTASTLLSLTLSSFRGNDVFAGLILTFPCLQTYLLSPLVFLTAASAVYHVKLCITAE